MSDSSELSFTLGDRLNWHHVVCETEYIVTFLDSNLPLSVDAKNAIGELKTRPRFIEFDEGEAVLILRMPVLTEEIEQLESIRFYFNGDTLYSFSRSPIYQVSQLKRLISKLKVSNSKMELLVWQIVDFIVSNVAQSLRAREEELIELEDEWLESHHMDVDRLHTLQQRLSAHGRFLPAQLDALNRLTVDFYDNGKKTGKLRYRWQDTKNEQKRSIEVLKEMKERIRILLESLQHRTNVELSHNMYVFSVVATFFLPLTFLTSLLGMNVSGIPQYSTFDFWVLCAVLGVFAFGQWMLFRRSKFWRKD